MRLQHLSSFGFRGSILNDEKVIKLLSVTWVKLLIVDSIIIEITRKGNGILLQEEFVRNYSINCSARTSSSSCTVVSVIEKNKIKHKYGFLAYDLMNCPMFFLPYCFKVVVSNL